MKKLFKLLLTTSIGVSVSSASAQVFISEDFSGTGTPSGWTSNGFDPNSTYSCNGNSFVDNIYTWNPTGDFSTNDEPANGGQIDIAFDYKIVDYSSQAATPANFGTLTLEHSIDGGNNWATDTVIDQSNHVPSTSCVTVSTFTTPTEVPNGSNVRYRFVANHANGDYYVIIDDVSIVEQVSCPAPSMLTPVISGTTTSMMGWQSNSSAAEWQIEYGPSGFTPGTGQGTTMIAPTNPFEISGLTPDEEYDVYVRGICSPGDTSGFSNIASINTYGQGLYMDSKQDCSPLGYVDITANGVANNLADDGNVGVTLPFTLLYHGIGVDDITIGNNGGILFGTLTGYVGTGGSPNGAGDGVFPFWDDLDQESGSIFYHTVGTAPNRTFIVQWENRPHYSGVVGQSITFQVQIDEATNEIYFVYDDVVFGGSQSQFDYGASAGIGAAGAYNDVTISLDDASYLTNNSCATLYYTDCPKPVNFQVDAVSTSTADVSWNAGIANEQEWTVIYGEEGFDPASGGTTTTTTSNSISVSNLDDVTVYDFYIFADCVPGTLQSEAALFGQAATNPFCSNPSFATSATMEDSISLEWNWTESTGNGTYPSTGFMLTYVHHDWDMEMGTEIVVDNNFTDTIDDQALLASGVYDVYVRAVCGTDSSYYVGPLPVIMPLTNDSSCLAEEIPVDGNNYTFNNVGATVQTSESTIAPPASGFNETDGWGASAIHASTWYTFTAPASGNVYISGKGEGFEGKIAVYNATTCNVFNSYSLEGANDDALDGSSAAPDFSICGLTPNQQYYILHSSENSGADGTFSISLRENNPEGGSTSGIIEVCSGETVNLFDGISNYDADGTWYEEIQTLNFSGSTFPTAGLAFQVFNFEYEVVDGCASDSIIQQVQVFGPSQAGEAGSLTVCKNEEFILFDGLSGNIDLDGTWYDPQNNTLSGNSDVAPNSPGQFNYDYITGNGVCPDDTSTVLIIVDAGCDALSTDDEIFASIEIYPNPTNGVLNIANTNSNGAFNFAIYDMNGKVLNTNNNVLLQNSTEKVDLSNYETGVYFVKVSNENATRTFKVVLQK